MHPTTTDHHLTSLASLGDPLRRALYHYVADRGQPTSRDDAATATGISPPWPPTTSTNSSTTASWKPATSAAATAEDQAPAAQPSTMSAPPTPSSSACLPATTPP
jgi:hypothetical protein